MPDDADVIAALLRELAAYEAMDDEVNAKGVRAQLQWKGWKPAKPSERAETAETKAATKKETR